MDTPRVYVTLTADGVERVSVAAPSPQARAAGVALYRRLVGKILDLDAVARSEGSRSAEKNNGDGLWISHEDF